MDNAQSITNANVIHPGTLCLELLTPVLPARQPERTRAENSASAQGGNNLDPAYRTVECDLTLGLDAARRAGDVQLIRHYSNLLMEASVESW